MFATSGHALVVRLFCSLHFALRTRLIEFGVNPHVVERAQKSERRVSPLCFCREECFVADIYVRGWILYYRSYIFF